MSKVLILVSLLLSTTFATDIAEIARKYCNIQMRMFDICAEGSTGDKGQCGARAGVTYSELRNLNYPHTTAEEVAKACYLACRLPDVYYTKREVILDKCVDDFLRRVK